MSRASWTGVHDCEALAVTCPLCGAPAGHRCARVGRHIPIPRRGEPINVFHHPRLRVARNNREQRHRAARHWYLAWWLHTFGDLLSSEDNHAPTP